MVPYIFIHGVHFWNERIHVLKLKKCPFVLEITLCTQMFLKGVMGECLWFKIDNTRNLFCCLGELRFYTWVTFSLVNKANRSRWCTTISPTSKKVIFEKLQVTCLGGRIGGLEHYACGTLKPEQLCHQTSTWFGSIRKKEKFHHIHSKPKCTIAYKAILNFCS